MKSNTTEEHIFWGLAGKVLSGDSNASESRQLETLMEHDGQLREVFEEMKTDHHTISTLNNLEKVDVDRAWANQLSLIQDNERKKRNLKLMMGVAATVLVFVIVGYFFRGGDKFRHETLSNQERIILPDGSAVTLNRNSQITYDATFGRRDRKLKLSGEAYFEVIRNPDKPFVVNTSQGFVKVLGTSFNVNAKRNTEVYVRSGKVLFSTLDGESKRLLTKDQFAYSENNQIAPSTYKNDDSPLLWMTKDLLFNNASLSEVMDKLGRVYNVDFSFADTASDCRHTGHYDNVSLDVILESLKTIYEINILEVDGKTKVNFVSCH